MNIFFNTINSVSQFYRKEGWQADRQNPCQMLVNEINSEASNDGHPTDDDSKPGIISYSYLWKVKAVAETRVF